MIILSCAYNAAMSKLTAMQNVVPQHYWSLLTTLTYTRIFSLSRPLSLSSCANYGLMSVCLSVCAFVSVSVPPSLVDVQGLDGRT